MVNFLQNRIYLLGNVKCMVCRAGCIKQDQTCRINCNRYKINPARLMSCFDKQRNCCKYCHQHSNKMCDRTSRIFYMFFYYFCHNLPLLKIMLYSSFVFSYVVLITTYSYINIITVIFKKASP